MRITTKTATLMDNIYLSIGIYENNHSFILNNYISDHQPCITQIGIDLTIAQE